MRKRESHTKSRNGCQNCKRRHVKCDEQGPPCANCKARKIDATCALPSSSSANTMIPTPPQDVVSIASSDSQQVALSSISDITRLLELELMNRWSTTTYKSLQSVPEDAEYFQIEIPRGALKYPFLLHGIFSISALDIAMCEEGVDSSLYACAALEHYDKASEFFRTELENVTPENHHYLVFFSVVAAAINMAIPQSIRVGQEHPQSSMLERMVVLFDLLLASVSLASMNWILLFESPAGKSMFSVLSLMEKTPLDLLDEDTEAAFTRMVTLVESMGKDEEVSEESSVFLKSYPAAVRHLHYCFIQDVKDEIKAFFSAFPSMAGPNYLSAVKKLEPLALFILMHWGVLLDKQSSKHWWAVSVGKILVAEVSEALIRAHSNLTVLPEWVEGIAWARGKVGLEQFGGREILSILD